MFKYHGDDLMERQGLKTEDKKKKKKKKLTGNGMSSVQFSRSVVSESL